MSPDKKDYYYLLEKGIDKISKEFFDENILLRKKLYGCKIKIRDKDLYKYYFERLSKKYDKEELDYILLLLREDREIHQGGWNRLISVMAIIITFMVGIVPVLDIFNLKVHLWQVLYSVLIIVFLIYAIFKESKYVRNINKYNRMIEIIEFYNIFIKESSNNHSANPVGGKCSHETN
ncbi:hypothetical protein ABFY48_09675 [Lysinibacillus pakistanensis]|uniref:hypothetical protein n=1 Tax=Lysinibacillus pakistanensis TaxID=759811 RepID=UPI003D2ABF14